jgi:cytoplasmic iron level regulating protein YaaA (DUF328/UPF0246 family)
MSRPVAALVACCKQKKNYPTEAIELYCSPLFKKSVEYAKSFGLPIYILSAKYGLISASRTIAPYDLTLNKMTASEKKDWAVKVASQIKEQFGNNTLLCLAGENYLKAFDYCENDIINPLASKGLGERLQWLERRLKSTK